MIQPVSDVGSNAEENIAHAAKVIGRSAHRRKVFEAIYTGKRKCKKVSDIGIATDLPEKRVLEEGKRLADNRLVKPCKLDGETAYIKIDFFHTNKRKILSLVSSPAKLKAFPTKRNPTGTARILKVKLSAQRAKVHHLTIDEIGSFARVRTTNRSDFELGNALSENQFKRGLQKIIGERGRFKDWGGEVADLFTTRIRINGKRRPTALALKGPGTKGKLTPGKMGKNGDQIQRLFEAPCEVFLVQYCRQIESSVVAQMQQLAIAKSLMTGNQICYGVIDGSDSRRLVDAYPKSFPRLRSTLKERV
ncbi:MAG: hypothetical protein LUQ65_13385 [Candidatus Helarchaeota archaeon]|nr:hypothetical protein [Candidatus Helarchaeota archaeon]